MKATQMDGVPKRIMTSLCITIPSKANVVADASRLGSHEGAFG